VRVLARDSSVRWRSMRMCSGRRIQTTQQCQRQLAALDDPDAATPKALRVYGAAGHLVSAALSVSPPLRAALRAYRSDAPPFPTQLI